MLRIRQAAARRRRTLQQRSALYFPGPDESAASHVESADYDVRPMAHDSQRCKDSGQAQELGAAVGSI